MKKMTLLEMTQNILSALDSDEVNSITDTVESLQVAEILKETFWEQFNNIHMPEFQKMFQLASVSDELAPNYLRVPENVAKIEWVNYNDYRNEGRPVTLKYMTPEEFLNRHFQYYSGSDHVFLTTDPDSGIQYYVRTDGPPTHFTMFGDKYIATDSVDLDFESVLQTSNNIGYGTVVDDFEMADDYVAPIDGNLYPLWLAEAKGTAFINLKQISSAKEEQRARRQRIRMQNDQFKSRQAQYGYRHYPDYSRNR